MGPSQYAELSFTLIELLVVIAIIAILAAILFPVFARARENARRASCQSNEKNIALGFKQYIQDNGEKYPPVMATAYDLKQSATGSGALESYIKSTAIFYCPSDSDKINGSYGYKLLNAENESVIENTTTTVLLNETGTRHFDGMNIAYVDGHVKWSKGGTPSTVGSAFTAASNCAGYDGTQATADACAGDDMFKASNTTADSWMGDAQFGSQTVATGGGSYSDQDKCKVNAPCQITVASGQLNIHSGYYTIDSGAEAWSATVTKGDGSTVTLQEDIKSSANFVYAYSQDFTTYGTAANPAKISFTSAGKTHNFYFYHS